MNIKVLCEFESIEFAELAIGELKKYKEKISGITLTSRKNREREIGIYSPLAAAGADIYNGPGGPSSENLSLSTSAILPAFSIGAFNDSVHTELEDDRTCKVKITCDISIKDTVYNKMLSLGAHNIRFTY